MQPAVTWRNADVLVSTTLMLVSVRSADGSGMIGGGAALQAKANIAMAMKMSARALQRMCVRLLLSILHLRPQWQANQTGCLAPIITNIEVNTTRQNFHN